MGIVTQTDLTRFQAMTSAELVARHRRAPRRRTRSPLSPPRIPQLLVQLVAGGNRHEVVTRLITDIADAATRRLLALAEARRSARRRCPTSGSPAAAQGRQEQTGVSDQDNCLILDDAATDAD